VRVVRKPFAIGELLAAFDEVLGEQRRTS
jgi:hypothetical protein